MTQARVVFEDERLLAVDKPAGQATIPGRGDIGETLLAQLQRERGARVFVVHRLDREAGGLVVFAKDAEAHRRLCAEFAQRRADKAYLAVAAGEMSGEGVCEQPLREFGSGRVAAAPDGKPSRTRWKVLRRLAGAALLRVEPETGRRHQIRAHLCALGHPLLGDPLYGPAPRPVGGEPRLLLHALELRVRVWRDYELRVEPGADFQAAVDSRLTAI